METGGKALQERGWGERQRGGRNWPKAPSFMEHLPYVRHCAECLTASDTPKSSCACKEDGSIPSSTTYSSTDGYGIQILIFLTKFAPSFHSIVLIPFALLPKCADCYHCPQQQLLPLS